MYAHAYIHVYARMRVVKWLYTMGVSCLSIGLQPHVIKHNPVIQTQIQAWLNSTQIYYLVAIKVYTLFTYKNKIYTYMYNVYVWMIWYISDDHLTCAALKNTHSSPHTRALYRLWCSVEDYRWNSHSLRDTHTHFGTYMHMHMYMWIYMYSCFT